MYAIVVTKHANIAAPSTFTPNVAIKLSARIIIKPSIIAQTALLGWLTDWFAHFSPYRAPQKCQARNFQSKDMG